MNNEKNLGSRSFTVVEVPDPVSISAKFVYNFFTTDERENDSGDNKVPFSLSNKDTQSVVNVKTLASDIPRYVEINYSPGTILDFGNFGDSKNFVENFSLDKIYNEESITNESFLSLRESDSDCKTRTSEKLKALSSLLNLGLEDSDQTKVLSQVVGTQKENLLPLISPYGSDLHVNFSPNDFVDNLYTRSSRNSINSLVNKRQLQIAANGISDISPLGSLKAKNLSKSISKIFLASCQDSSITLDDVEPTLHPFLTEDADPKIPNSLLGASLVGYVISRKQYDASGVILDSTKTWPVFGRDNTTFLDTEILYGSKYSYSVRNVFRVDAVVDFTNVGILSKKKVSCFIASKPTQYESVLTEENVAPEPPDGIFYRFNYDEGKGLIITWQIPPGKSRDVKYFQVFRRNSIYEPFACLAEIDFDDSEVKTLRTETVREDLVKKIKPGLATSYFVDKSFKRDSAPSIYAVCAVDAHSLTSCYSTQTLVGFDRISNKLTLKNISRPGAPKQYPNFFVDPRLDENIAVDSFSQDAIFDSGHTRFDFYFTPDAKVAKSINGNSSNAFVTDKQNGSYSMHVINLDLQKSDTVEIVVNDLRKFA